MCVSVRASVTGTHPGVFIVLHKLLLQRHRRGDQASLWLSSQVWRVKCVCVCMGVLSRSDTQNVLFLSDILLISFWPDTGELLFFFLTWGWIQLCTGMTNRSIWVLIIAAHAGYFSWLLLLHTIRNSRCANRGVFTGTRQQKRNYSCNKDMHFYKNVRL